MTNAPPPPPTIGAFVRVASKSAWVRYPVLLGIAGTLLDTVDGATWIRDNWVGIEPWLDSGYFRLGFAAVVLAAISYGVWKLRQDGIIHHRRELEVAAEHATANAQLVEQVYDRFADVVGIQTDVLRKLGRLRQLNSDIELFRGQASGAEALLEAVARLAADEQISVTEARTQIYIIMNERALFSSALDARAKAYNDDDRPRLDMASVIERATGKYSVRSEFTETMQRHANQLASEATASRRLANIARERKDLLERELGPFAGVLR